jgi:hypothetical protein
MFSAQEHIIHKSFECVVGVVSVEETRRATITTPVTGGAVCSHVNHGQPLVGFVHRRPSMEFRQVDHGRRFSSSSDTQ